jgi:hypothetical protein
VLCPAIAAPPNEQVAAASSARCSHFLENYISSQINSLIPVRAPRPSPRILLCWCMNPSIYPGAAEPRALKAIGRPAFHPTDEDRTKVVRMSLMGIPQTQIAIVFGISSKTLRKHFRKELNAAVEANFKVVTTLYQMATSGKNTAASIFWAKTRCGFRYGGPFDAEPDPAQPETIDGAPHAD